MSNLKQTIESAKKHLSGTRTSINQVCIVKFQNIDRNSKWFNTISYGFNFDQHARKGKVELDGKIKMLTIKIIKKEKTCTQ